MLGQPCGCTDHGCEWHFTQKALGMSHLWGPLWASENLSLTSILLNEQKHDCYTCNADVFRNLSIFPLHVKSCEYVGNVVKYRHAYLQTLRRDGERGLGMQSNSRCHRTVVQQTNINQHKPTNIYLLHIQISSYQILKRTWNIWHRNMHVHGLSMCKRLLLSTLGARFTFLWPRTTWACPNPPVIAQHRAKLTSNVTRGVQLSQRTFVMTFVMTFLHDDFHSEIILPWYPGASHICASLVLKQLHSWWQDKRTYPIPGSCFDCALHTDLAGSLNWVPMGYRWLQYHILKWSPINQ